MRKVFFIVLVSVFLFAGRISCQAETEQVSRVRSLRMANGMTLIFIPIGNSANGSIYIGFKAGTLLDEEGFGGQARLLQRLMFKGTEHIGTRDWEKERQVFDELEKTGDQIIVKHQADKPDQKEIQDLVRKALQLQDDVRRFYVPDEMKKLYDAYGAGEAWCLAGEDLLEFQTSFPRNYLEYFLLLESERIKEPVFRNFYEERELLAAEMEKASGRPGDERYAGLLSFVYGDGPYSGAAAGRAGEVRKITLSGMKKYAAKALNPKGAVIVVSGDYDFEKVAALCGKYFESVPSGEDTLIRDDGVIPAGKTPEAGKDPAGGTLLLAYLKPPGYSPRTEALLDLLVLYLSRGGAASLTGDRSAGFSGGICRNGDPGRLFRNLFLMELRLRDNVSREAAKKEAVDFFKNLCSSKFDNALFERTRRGLLIEILGSMEGQEGLSRRTGECFLYSGDAGAADAYVSALRSAVPEDLNNAARELFSDANRIQTQ